MSLTIKMRETKKKEAVSRGSRDLLDNSELTQEIQSLYENEFKKLIDDADEKEKPYYQGMDYLLEDYIPDTVESIQNDMYKYVSGGDYNIPGNFKQIDWDWDRDHKDGIKFNDLCKKLLNGVNDADTEEFSHWGIDWFFKAFGTFGLKYNFRDLVWDLVYNEMAEDGVLDESKKRSCSMQKKESLANKSEATTKDILVKLTELKDVTDAGKVLDDLKKLGFHTIEYGDYASKDKAYAVLKHPNGMYAELDYTWVQDSSGRDSYSPGEVVTYDYFKDKDEYEEIHGYSPNESKKSEAYEDIWRGAEVMTYQDAAEQLDLDAEREQDLIDEFGEDYYNNPDAMDVYGEELLNYIDSMFGQDYVSIDGEKIPLGLCREPKLLIVLTTDTKHGDEAVELVKKLANGELTGSSDDGDYVAIMDGVHGSPHFDIYSEGEKPEDGKLA